ncbi:MAG: helix-turn-helix domain-containing protein [Dactylosporangium sp.]|nr:helix-turn-helix domain-containing protein [Dactylosporangium sp.]NNJ63776.1 helix-turn-helix domain-containing protein [Dactylosporangium sp.]
MAASPTIRRRRLAAELRRLRESAGMTLEEAAAQIEVSKSALSRIETAKAGARVPIVRLLLGAYGVDRDTAEALLGIARDAGRKGWWHQYSHAIPAGLESFLSFEGEATGLRHFATMAIPGVLQTPEYAQTVVREHSMNEPQEIVDSRVRLRLSRQKEILRGRDAFDAWFLLDEAVLRRMVGGRDTMVGQLSFVLELLSAGKIGIQVLPFSIGAHPSMAAGFSIFRFAEGLPIVYIEHLDSAVYIEDHAKTRHYSQAFERLVEMAPPASQSSQIISNVLKELARGEPRSQRR